VSVSLRALVAAGKQVRALTRGADRPLAAGVEQAVGDLNRPESVSGALAGVRSVFLLIGYRRCNRGSGSPCCVFL
jgi:uncharacterized protein YbjT (DUF2867 family)